MTRIEELSDEEAIAAALQLRKDFGMTEDDACSVASNAEIANAASEHCMCQTAADGWIFGHIDELRAFLMALAARDAASK